MGCTVSSDNARDHGKKVKFCLPPLQDAVQATISRTGGKPGRAVKGKKFAALVEAAKFTELARKGFEGERKSNNDSFSQAQNNAANGSVIPKARLPGGILHRADDTRVPVTLLGDNAMSQERKPVRKLSDMRSRIAVVALFQAELRKQREKRKENAYKLDSEENDPKLIRNLAMRKILGTATDMNQGYHSEEDIEANNAPEKCESDSFTGHHLRRRLWEKAIRVKKCAKFGVQNSDRSSQSD